MNKDIGKNAERELTHLLERFGFKAVRIPTSNSSSNPLPDVFAVKGNVLLSIEVKSTWREKVKVRENQVRKLFQFSSLFPLTSFNLIVVKFKRREWRVFQLNAVKEVEVSIEGGEELESFLSNLEEKIDFKSLVEASA